MLELLNKFDAGQLIGLVGVIGGLLVAALAVVITQWRRVRLAEMETGLKQQMLEKGMSPAEIGQVMNASRERAAAGSVVSTGNEAADKAALVQRMVDEGYEGEDIERVLKAYQPTKPAEDQAVANQP